MELSRASAADAASIQRLLISADLPATDLSESLLEDFLVLREGPVLIAVIGLEVAGDSALLRSLVVSESARDAGIGRQLVQAAETLARQRGVRVLYLLTTTAADYFFRLGYRHTTRASAPDAIRATPQFSGLCPSSSAFMAKDLQ